MDQKNFDNLRPGDLVGFKHKKETLGLVTRSRKKGRPWNPFSRPDVEYIEVTIDWRDEDGTFIGMYASDDNPSLEQLRIIVKAKNDEQSI